MTPTSIPLSEVLDMLGVAADAKGQWRVTAVRENSPSAKSGVKIGDVITALDDKDINTESAFLNSGSVKVITVRRDGKLIPLKVTTH
jgi:S1-C subfamily serine protease